MTDRFDYILAILEERNLTRAAQRLYLSQPALTSYLNRLEQELGVKIFDRSVTPIELTPAGTYYIKHMKSLRIAEQTMRQNLQTIAHPEQTLNISIGQVRGYYWMPTALSSFVPLHPNINIHIIQDTEQNNLKALSEGRTDLLIGNFTMSPEHVHKVYLGAENFYLAAHKDLGLVPADYQSENSLENPYTIQPEFLRDYCFILPEPFNGMYPIVKQIFDDNDLTPSHSIIVNNLLTGLQMVRKGLGIELVCTSVLKQEQCNDKTPILDYLVLPKMSSSGNCVALYHENNLKSDLLEEFIGILKTKVLPTL